MEGEGLVLALVTVCEACCHHRHALRRFVMSSLSLCLRMASLSSPCSVFSLLSHCGGMSSSWLVVGVSSWHVLVSYSPCRCPALCCLLHALSVI